MFDELGFPPITDEEVEAATYANGSRDVGTRNVPEDLKGAERLMAEGITGVDIARILAKRGFRDVAEALVMMMRQRVSGDYLQTSAWIGVRRHGAQRRERPEHLRRSRYGLPAHGGALERDQGDPLGG